MKQRKATGQKTKVERTEQQEHRRSLALALAATVTACALAITLHGIISNPSTGSTPTATATGVAQSISGVATLSAATLAALPEARYNAVIPTLIEYSPGTAPLRSTTYSLSTDRAIYGADKLTPIARFAANSFLGTPTIVVGVLTQKHWVQVLTPARQKLPSKNNGDAPAQTFGWMPEAALTFSATNTARIVVNNAAQTLSITEAGVATATYPVGVGTAGTPTPTGVTGYIQARYLDAAQNETVHPIQLSSLHSSAKDEPYGGKDGGLIGVHYQDINTGAVSHGCIRLSATAITAVNALPPGTLLTIEP